MDKEICDSKLKSITAHPKTMQCFIFFVSSWDQIFASNPKNGIH